MFDLVENTKRPFAEELVFMGSMITYLRDHKPRDVEGGLRRFGWRLNLDIADKAVTNLIRIARAGDTNAS